MGLTLEVNVLASSYWNIYNTTWKIKKNIVIYDKFKFINGSKFTVQSCNKTFAYAVSYSGIRSIKPTLSGII